MKMIKMTSTKKTEAGLKNLAGSHGAARLMPEAHVIEHLTKSIIMPET